MLAVETKIRDITNPTLEELKNMSFTMDADASLQHFSDQGEEGVTTLSKQHQAEYKEMERKVEHLFNTIERMEEKDRQKLVSAFLSNGEQKQPLYKLSKAEREAALQTMPEKLQNIGDIGISPDFSQTELRNAIELDHPFLTWLLNTPLSQRVDNYMFESLANPHKATNGDWVIMLPASVYTTPPEDTGEACCWVPMELGFCNDYAPLRMLCLKDCYPILDAMINRRRRAGSNDLTGYFMNPGETVQMARRRMARLTMAYLTALNVLLGSLTTSTGVLKPFHGFIDLIEDEAVYTVDGSNILGAFDSLRCRLSQLTAGQWAFGMHPLIYDALVSAMVPDRWGRYPAGWTVNGNTVTWGNNVRFIADKAIPISLADGVGEIWGANGNYTGAWLATNLQPTDDYIYTTYIANDVVQDGCAVECEYMYNYGTTFNTNPNYLLRIINVPFSAQCSGTALSGLDDILIPNTLVPSV